MNRRITKHYRSHKTITHIYLTDFEEDNSMSTSKKWSNTRKDEVSRSVDLISEEVQIEKSKTCI